MSAPAIAADSEPTLLEAALAAAALNLPVFPTWPRSKKPATKRGLLDATTDPDRIKSRWRWQPRANVAVALPENIAVVDVDGELGRSSIRGGGFSLPSTVTVETGRADGGLHCYYTTERPVRCGELLPGVDVKSHGGYTLLPPSIHPSGAVYRWRESFAWEALCELPEWVLELRGRDTTATARPVEEWRSLARDGVEEGCRNVELARLAGHLLRRYVDPYVVLELCSLWNESRCRPPLPEAELVRTVDSIAGAELRRREARR